MDNAITLLQSQTSSDVGMSDMMTASARHRWTLAKRSGTKPKFFNDFSRAHARAREGTAIRSLYGAGWYEERDSCVWFLGVPFFVLANRRGSTRYHRIASTAASHMSYPRCPLYPQKRTSELSLEMFALCQ